MSDLPPATPAEAATRLDQLKGDSAWTQSFLSGGSSQAKEFNELTTLIAKGDSVDLAMAGVMVDAPFQPPGHMLKMGAAEMFRELGIRDNITKDVLSGTHTVTPAEFKATEQWKADHMKNKEWVSLYLSGDGEAARQMALANIILTGGIRESQ